MMNIKCWFYGHQYRAQYVETSNSGYIQHHGSMFCYRCGKEQYSHELAAAEARANFDIAMHNLEVIKWQAKQKAQRKQKVWDFHKRKRNIK